jgi:WD40 repeat protein
VKPLAFLFAFLLALAGHERNVWEARFSPDGRRLVTSADDGVVTL